jgi:hypothetical protein
MYLLEGFLGTHICLATAPTAGIVQVDAFLPDRFACVVVCIRVLKIGQLCQIRPADVKNRMN